MRKNMRSHWICKRMAAMTMTRTNGWLLLVTERNTCPTSRHRSLATSAQKRKQNKKTIKPSVRLSEKPASPLKVSHDDVVSSKREFDWNALFFLGIFPITMTAWVVWMRGDLTEDLYRQGQRWRERKGQYKDVSKNHTNTSQ